MTAQPITTRQPVAPIRCASWCAYGDGHPSAYHREDQHCDSVQINIDTTLEKPWEMCDDTEQTAYIITLVRKYPDATPHVVVVTPEDREVKLTPQEARDLADALRHFAWVASQDSEKHNAFRLGVDVGHTGTDLTVT